MMKSILHFLFVNVPELEVEDSLKAHYSYTMCVELLCRHMGRRVFGHAYCKGSI